MGARARPDAMRLDPDALRAALAEVPAGDASPAVAARLCAFIEAHRTGSAIAELYAAGPWVHVVLESGDPRFWEIDCLSPNDFHMYPGFERGDDVVWANIWVRDNMDVEELVKTINDVAFQNMEESGNA
jgi:hypothetical protein